MYPFIAIFNEFVYNFTDIIFIKIALYFMLVLPLWFKPLAKFLDNDTLF